MLMAKENREYGCFRVSPFGVGGITTPEWGLPHSDAIGLEGPRMVGVACDAQPTEIE